jgi:hypothetical protein
MSYSYRDEIAHSVWLTETRLSYRAQTPSETDALWCRANFAFVEPEREYGPAPFGRHSACTIC